MYDDVDIIAHKSIISTVLSDAFPRINEGKNIAYEINAINGPTPIIKSSSETNGIILMSADAYKRINFTNNSVALSIFGNVYKRYEDIIPTLQEIEEILTKMGIASISRSSVRKINIISFTSHADSLSGIFEDLFSPGIVNAIDSFPQPKALKQNMHSTVFNENNFRLNINYGVPEFDNTKKPLSGSVVIDIDLLKNSISSTTGIINDTTIINNEIYNVFSWMISTKMKEEIMGHE